MPEHNSSLRQFTVPESCLEERVDKVLAHCFVGWSRSKIQKLLDEGAVLSAGRVLKKKDMVYAGDSLSISLPQEAPQEELQPVQQSLDIVYEDEAIILINKAPFVTVHPGNGTLEDTLVHGLLYHCKGHLSQAGDASRPGVVHRLDKETSGLIVFAKQDSAYLSLLEQFKERVVKKEYLALVRGLPRFKAGSIQVPIQRHTKLRTKMQVGEGGRFAHTDWALERSFGNRFSLLRCFLFTGRTHQIRVHLAHLHLPIMGDSTYGYRFQKDDPIRPGRVLLHAQRLSFQHPLSGEILSFEVPPPADFQSALDLLDAWSKG